MSKKPVKKNADKDIPLDHSLTPSFLHFINKPTQGLIENFLIDAENSLFSFFRRRISLVFEKTELCQLDNLKIGDEPFFISTIHFKPTHDAGFILYETAFMEKAIHILFGGEENIECSSDKPIIGKVGSKIGNKITELIMESFKEVFKEKISLDTHVINGSIDPTIIQKEESTPNLIKLTISTELEQLKTSITCIFPSPIFEDNFEMHAYSKENKPSLNLELSDSSVTLIGVLPEIQLKIKDIMNLKSGDLIPILDPTAVHVCVNDKILFKGSVGSDNNKKDIKITQPVY